jgi:hypothetical protein
LRLSADELLWGKLNDDWAELDRLKAEMGPPSEQQRQQIEKCEHLLEKAESCLNENRSRWRYGRDSDMFWTLVHQADEEMVLLMTPERLAVTAMSVSSDVRRKIADGSLRDAWLKEDGLPAVVDRHRTPASANAQLALDRQLVQAAMRDVNGKADRGFWQLAMNMRIKLWSAVELALIGLVVLWWSEHLYALFAQPYGTRSFRGLVAMLGLGAAGAVLSNMLYSQKLNVPDGPTQTLWAVLYYLFVVSMVGAAAGALLVGVARSELLFSFGSAPAASSAAPVQIRLGARAVPYAYMVLAGVAGFLGDRSLRTTFEAVYTAMFHEASKDVSSHTRDKTNQFAG